MPRPKRYVEHLGFQATQLEAQVFKAYLKARGLSATEFFRQEVLKPLIAAKQTEDERNHGGSDAA